MKIGSRSFWSRVLWKSWEFAVIAIIAGLWVLAFYGAFVVLAWLAVFE